jgi:hypothetical protein
VKYFKVLDAIFTLLHRVPSLNETMNDSEIIEPMEKLVELAVTHFGDSVLSGFQATGQCQHSRVQMNSMQF